jgi:hypothetical protein
MRLPDGYDKYMLEVHNVVIDPSTNVPLLKKKFYGLVHSARHWWKQFKEVLATCFYYPSKSDSWLFIKKVEDIEPISFVILYIDDGGIIGTPDAITEVIAALGRVFKVKTLGDMDKNFGCHYRKNGVWIHQPKLLKILNAKFKNVLGDTMRIYPAPSAPKTLIICPNNCTWNTEAIEKGSLNVTILS